MAKHNPITVSSVAYVHTEDVDVEQHVNAGPITEAMDVCVARAQTALDAPAGQYSEFHRANMQNVFMSMQSTHHAIRKILKWGDEELGSARPSLGRVMLANAQMRPRPNV